MNFEQQPINIKDLAVKEPEKKPEAVFDFDPRKDITEDNWEEIGQVLKLWHSFDTEMLTLFLSGVKLLCPEMLSEQNWARLFGWERNELWNKAKSRLVPLLRGLGDKTTMIHDIRTALNLAFILPEKSEMITTAITGELISILKDYAAKEDLRSFFEFAAKVKMASPLLFSKVISFASVDLNNGFWNKTKDFFGELLLGRPDEALRFAAHVKILFPERFSEIRMPLKVWQEGKALVEFQRKDGHAWDYFLLYAPNLAVLSAKEIKFTDHGPELVFREEHPRLQEPIPPMPETRNF